MLTLIKQPTTRSISNAMISKGYSFSQGGYNARSRLYARHLAHHKKRAQRHTQIYEEPDTAPNVEIPTESDDKHDNATGAARKVRADHDKATYE